MKILRRSRSASAARRRRRLNTWSIQWRRTKNRICCGPCWTRSTTTRSSFFSGLKNRADRIGHMLKKNIHAVATLHSNRTQRERGTSIARLSRWPLRSPRRHGYCGARVGRADVSHVIQFRCAPAPGGLRPSDWRTGRARRWATLHVDGRGRRFAHGGIERFIGPENRAGQAGEFNSTNTRPL